MGLFGGGAVSQVDERLLMLLADPGQQGFRIREARASLDFHQAALRDIDAREPIRQIIKDQATGADKHTLLVLTRDGTYHLTKKGLRLHLSYAEIADTWLGRLPKPNDYVIILITSKTGRANFSDDDPAGYPHRIQLAVIAPPVAQAAVGLIDSRLDSAKEPRDVPLLNPGFYQQILARVNLEVSPNNLTELAFRVSNMLRIGGAYRFFEQASDSYAQAQFDEVFPQEGSRDNAALIADQMIDWLWEWDARSHAELRSLIPRIERILTAPDSGLFQEGPELARS